MKWNKRTQEAAHKLIAQLQQQFGLKDSMFPMEEQIFDNLIYEAFYQFQQGGQGLIEVKECFISLDQITAIQFDHKPQLIGPDNLDGLRCRVLTVNGPAPFEFYGKDARRIRSFCKRYRVEEDSGSASND